MVRPDKRVKVVNHPEGGRVTAIMVRDGDEVKKGDVLLSLDPNLIAEEVEKRRDQFVATSLDVERLRAEALRAVCLPSIPNWSPSVPISQPRK